MMSRVPARWQLSLLAIVLVLFPGAADAAAWVRVETPNFVVIGEPSEQQVREVAEQFERFRQALGRIFPGATTAAPVPTIVVVFNTRRSFEPFRPRFNGRSVELDGYVAATANQNLVALTVESRDRALGTIFHEYAHLVFANLMRDLPVWVSEGLAEYYSTFAIQAEGRTAVIGTPIREHLVRLNRRRLIPHQELLEVDQSSALYNEGERRSVFYAQSWALVHMLTMGEPDRSGELAQYIMLASTGIPSHQAWAQVFGAFGVNHEIQKYVRRPRLNTVNYRFDQAIPAVPAAVSVASQSHVEAALADLLYHVHVRDQALTTLERAVSMQPSSAHARALLGLRRFEENRSDEAQRLFVEALRDKGDWLGQYYAAIGLTHLVDQTEGAEQLKLAALARQALAIVDTARPRLPNALAMRAGISAKTRTNLEEALKDIQQARALAPGRDDYGFLEAHVRLARGEFAAARTVLSPLMSPRYHTSVRDRARDLMAQVVKVESGMRQTHPPSAADGTSPGNDEVPPKERLSPVPAFRKMQAGEQRTEGMLERIECARRGILLHLQTGDGLVTFTAARIEAIDFITYRSESPLDVTCQPRTPPDRVYVTWRPAVAPVQHAIAIAVEFLPSR